MRRILRIALRFECSLGLDHSRWRDHNVGSWYWSLFNSNGIHIYIYIHTSIHTIHPSIHPYIYILCIDLGDHWITGLFLGIIVANCFCFFVAKRWQKTCWVSAASPQWPGTQVGYEVLRWEEGKVIAFDDTFIHQASLESLESWFPGAPEFFVEIFVGGWELLDSWCFIDFQRV